MKTSKEEQGGDREERAVRNVAPDLSIKRGRERGVKGRKAARNNGLEGSKKAKQCWFT